MAAVATVQANSARKVLQAAAERGADSAGLLAAVGLTHDALSNPDGRIPFRALARLYEVAAAQTGDDAFGLRVGAASNPRMFDVLGYAALASETLGDAFAVIQRYYRVLQEGALLDVERRGASLVIRYRIVDPSVGSARHETEATLAIVLRLLEAATGGPVALTAVHFAHPAPARGALHREVFRCPLVFGASANEIHAPSALLDARIASADPALGTVLRRHLREQLERLPAEGELVEQVRRLVVEQLHRGPASSEAIARRLGMSERTLQRRLSDIDVTFSGVVDEVRRGLAARYLAEPRMSIAEVAFALGYADLPSFYRAHRRWTGTTPAAVRARDLSTLPRDPGA